MLAAPHGSDLLCEEFCTTEANGAGLRDASDGSRGHPTRRLAPFVRFKRVDHGFGRSQVNNREDFWLAFEKQN
jgi:hypothetical protein